MRGAQATVIESAPAAGLTPDQFTNAESEEVIALFKQNGRHTAAERRANIAKIRTANGVRRAKSERKLPSQEGQSGGQDKQGLES